eukprot:1544083-Prymnesium_polylepis.1
MHGSHADRVLESSRRRGRLLTLLSPVPRHAGRPYTHIIDHDTRARRTATQTSRCPAHATDNGTRNMRCAVLDDKAPRLSHRRCAPASASEPQAKNGNTY